MFLELIRKVKLEGMNLVGSNFSSKCMSVFLRDLLLVGELFG